MTRLILILWLLPVLSFADLPILQKNEQIDITTSFRGTNIELTTFLPQDDPAATLVVTGPLGNLTFRTKERRAGLWINAKKVELDQVATYVAMIGLSQDDLDAACNTDQFEGSLIWVCDPAQRALMAEKGLFVLEDGPTLTDLGDGFFSANAFLPPTAKPGTYTLSFTAGGETAKREFQVRRAGLERLVLDTAQNHRLFYGVLCLLIAGLAGYVTNLISSRRA